ncbi:MAG TPA: formate dehydrogenase accessory sulfurtransferase FdhD [Actinomycetota bacterium]|nr:formate dehydrogenase accessory sulfurtransferase FdhD [Actinomycetota bacterium]
MALRHEVEQVGGRPAERRRVTRIRDGRVDEGPDFIAAEEPLEIRLAGEQVAVTMRTPGHDTELAVGFLIGEGIVLPQDVAGVAECRSDEGDGGVADVRLAPGAAARSGWQRNFYATSSCGVCGKASIEAVRVAAGPVDDGPVVSFDALQQLPDRLRDAQRVFDRTGGLHAAGLFTADGELETLREDVGRHNAVDKVIGHHALGGDLPLGSRVLLVSGRASFELVQKALVAGIPFVAAVSAPSTLAVRLAEESNMTLVGFLRPGGCNVYAGRERLAGV